MAAIWLRIDSNLAWSVLTSWLTRVRRCLALLSCCSAWSYIWAAWSCWEVSRFTDFWTWLMVGLGVAPAEPANVARAPAATTVAPIAAPRRSIRVLRADVPRIHVRERSGSAAGRVLTYVITLLLPLRLPGELTGSGCGRCPTAGSRYGRPHRGDRDAASHDASWPLHPRKTLVPGHPRPGL